LLSIVFIAVGASVVAMRAFLETTKAAVRKTQEAAVSLATTPSQSSSVTATTTAKAQKNKELLKALRAQNRKLKHLYTVLSKSKKETDSDLSVFRAFAHQVLPDLVPSEKLENEQLDVNFLLAAYEKSRSTPSTTTAPSSTSPIDPDLLGLNVTTTTTNTNTNIEHELRKELSEMKETKDKILTKFREAVKRLRSLQQKYNTLAEQSKETLDGPSSPSQTQTQSPSTPTNTAADSTKNAYEDTIAKLKHQLNKESTKRIKLQETMEKMDEDLAAVEQQRISISKRVKIAEEDKLQAQKSNRELSLELENATRIASTASVTANETKALTKKLESMNIDMKEMQQDLAQLPALEKKVGTLEIQKTALINQTTSTETELQEIRALYEDARKQLSEQQQQDQQLPDDELEKNNSLVARIETIENEKKHLLAQGKKLHSTHLKLKKDYHQLQEQCSKADSVAGELKLLSTTAHTKQIELEAKIKEQNQSLQLKTTKYDELVVKMTAMQETHNLTLKAEQSNVLALQEKYKHEIQQQKHTNEQRKNLQDELNATNIKLASALASTESIKSNAGQDESLKTELKTKICTLEQHLNQEKQAHKATAALHATELETLVSQQQSSNESASTELQQKLSTAMQELEEYKANATTTNEKVQERCVVLEQQLQSSIAKEQDFAKKGKLLVKKIKEMKEENSNVKIKVNQLTQQLGNASSTADSQMLQLKKTSDDAQTRLEETLLQLSAREAETVALAKQLRERTNEVENSDMKMKQDLKKEKQKQEKLQTQLKNASKEHETAVLRLNTYWKNEIDTIKSSTSTTSKTMQEEITSLTKTVGDTKENNTTLTKTNSELDKRILHLQQQHEKTQTEWQERMSAIQASVEETKKEVWAADKRTEEQRFALQESTSSSAQTSSKLQGELRVAHERIERLLKTNREKDTEHQERMGSLQRSLEEMRHQAASVNAEQGEMDAIQAALDSKQAALEDVKKADRRIITDLKREMTKILRQTKMEKDEQIMIAEKALSRLRQEEDRGSQLEEAVIVLRDDLNAKSKEVDMAMLQIEQLSAIAGSSGGGLSDASTSSAATVGGGLMSWFTGASAPTPTRGRGMGIARTPARLTRSTISRTIKK
jgi:hypothetical protein